MLCVCVCVCVCVCRCVCVCVWCVCARVHECIYIHNVYIYMYIYDIYIYIQCIYCGLVYNLPSQKTIMAALYYNLHFLFPSKMMTIVELRSDNFDGVKRETLTFILV